MLWGLSTKVWRSANGSGERSAVGCADTAEGTGMRGCAAGRAPRGSMVCLKIEAPVLRGVQGEGRAATAPTCQLLPPQTPGGTPARGSTPQSVATA